LCRSLRQDSVDVDISALGGEDQFALAGEEEAAGFYVVSGVDATSLYRPRGELPEVLGRGWSW
jgi:hypothetical protein